MIHSYIRKWTLAILNYTITCQVQHIIVFMPLESDFHNLAMYTNNSTMVDLHLLFPLMWEHNQTLSMTRV